MAILSNIVVLNYIKKGELAAWPLFFLLWQNTVNKATYKRKRFIWDLGLQRVSVHDHNGGEHASWQTGTVQWQQWRTYIRICRQNGEKTNWNGMGFGNPEAQPQWYISSNKATLPNSSEIFLPTGAQVFKWISLRGTFLSKVPHSLRFINFLFCTIWFARWKTTQQGRET